MEGKFKIVLRDLGSALSLVDANMRFGDPITPSNLIGGGAERQESDLTLFILATCIM